MVEPPAPVVTTMFWRSSSDSNAARISWVSRGWAKAVEATKAKAVMVEVNFIVATGRDEDAQECGKNKIIRETL